MAGQATDRFARAVRFSRIASALAFCFGVSIAVAAQSVGLYSSETTDRNGLVVKTTELPLVDDPTFGQWLLLAVPAVIALVVAALIFFAIKNQSRTLLLSAWVPAGLSVLLCVPAVISIGFLVIPYVIALVLSVFLAQNAFDIQQAVVA